MAEAAGGLLYDVGIGLGLAGGASIPGVEIGTGTGAGAASIPAVPIVPGESTGAVLSGSVLIPGESSSSVLSGSTLIPGEAASSGAFFLVDFAPLYSTGAVFDHFVEVTPEVASGPICDHPADMIATYGAGPVDDHFAGETSGDSTGVLVDYTVVVIPGPYDPLNPNAVDTPQQKIPTTRNPQCTGTGGDESPGVCGRPS